MSTDRLRSHDWRIDANGMEAGTPDQPGYDPDTQVTGAAEEIWDIIVAVHLFDAWHRVCPDDTWCTLRMMRKIATEEVKAGRLRHVEDLQVHIACHFAAHADVFFNLAANCGMLGFADGFRYVQNFCSGGYV